MTRLRNLVLGNYAARSSFVHRLDPRAKLLFVILISVALFSGGSWLDLAVWSGVILVAAPAAHISLRLLWSGMRAFLWFIGLAFVLQFFLLQPPGLPFWELREPAALAWKLERSAFFSSRLVLFIAYSSLLTLVTSPLELADGIERSLARFRKWRVAAHELGMMISIAIRFVPTITAEVERITRAQQARGAEPGRGLRNRVRFLVPLIIPLFVATFHRAEELALAMEARCYDSRARRTGYVQMHWGWRESALLVCAVALFAAIRLLS